MKSKKVYLNDKGEPISRQRYHQIKNKKLGLCHLCSKPAEVSNKGKKLVHCESCRVKNQLSCFKHSRIKSGKPMSDLFRTHRTNPLNKNDNED